MRTIQHLILVWTMLSCHMSFSQEPQYRWGEPVRNPDPFRKITQVLSIGEQGFVVLRTLENTNSAYRYWLEYYNPQMNFIRRKELEFDRGTLSNLHDIEQIFTAGETMYVLMSHWDKSQQANALSLHTIGQNGELQKQMDLDHIVAKKLGNNGHFKMALSKDETKLLILSEQAFVKKTEEKIKLSCFDLESGQKLWSQERSLDWPSSRIPSNTIAVNNQGHAFLFKEMWAKPLWKYAVYATDGEGLWVKHVNKDFTTHQIENFKMSFDANDEFLLLAAFSHSISNIDKQINGTWFLKLEKLQERTNALFPWTPQQMVLFESSQTAEQGALEHISNLKIKDILVRSDNKLLVLYEQQKREQNTVPGTSPTQYVYAWKYRGAMVTCLDPESGTMEWWKGFYKRQNLHDAYKDDHYGSYIYHLQSDRLYLLWNNTELSSPKISHSSWKEPNGRQFEKRRDFHRKTVHGTFMHVIDANGEMVYENTKYGFPLFGLHEGTIFEMSITTHLFFKIGNQLAVMASMHNGGKRYRFGLIDL